MKHESTGSIAGIQSAAAQQPFAGRPGGIQPVKLNYRHPEGDSDPENWTRPATRRLKWSVVPHTEHA